MRLTFGAVVEVRRVSVVHALFNWWVIRDKFQGGVGVW